MGVLATLLEVKPLPDYRLWLRYSDGVSGEVSCSHLVGKGVFKMWENVRIFEQVALGPHGELVWHRDVDLCADALYLELTGKRPEEVFPNLNIERVDA